MGLFGIGNKPAKKMRGPAKSGMEKLNAQKARGEALYNRWLAGLQQRGDPRFDEMMLSRHGVPPDTRDPVQYMVKTKKALAEAGMIKEDSGSMADMVRQFAPLVQGLMPGGGQPAQAGLPQPPPGYVWALVPVGGTGQPSQPQRGPEPLAPGTTAVTTTEPPQQGEVSQLSQRLIDRFQDAAPEEAATAFLGAPAPLVGQLAQLLCETPDDKLDMLLGHLGVDNPNMADAFDWMRARPDWLRGFAVAVRKAKGAPAVVDSPPSSAA